MRRKRDMGREEDLQAKIQRLTDDLDKERSRREAALEE
jgi:hypothetical protein